MSVRIQGCVGGTNLEYISPVGKILARKRDSCLVILLLSLSMECLWICAAQHEQVIWSKRNEFSQLVWQAEHVEKLPLEVSRVSLMFTFKWSDEL